MYRFYFKILLILFFSHNAISQNYEVPRNEHGQPVIEGIWQAFGTAVWDIQDHSPSFGVPAGIGVVEDNVIPYQEWALEQRKVNFENRFLDDSEANCELVGVPRITYMPYPFQIIQTKDQVVITYEWVHTIRNIYMDSAHPPGPIQWYMGDSRGHWEGDSLIVDVVHFTDKTWFDRSGNFHSPSLHVVEKYTPISPNHMLYEVNIEDPEVFTRPWNMSMILYRRLEEDLRILEYECYALADDLIPR
tara:strand:- start:361 stop:1098 length:738 start_codon:yes stop_codon:yes gene_type:complete